MKLAAIDGSATFTIVTSMPTINRLMQQIASTASRRRSLSSGVPFTPDRFSVIGVRNPDQRRGREVRERSCPQR